MRSIRWLVTSSGVPAARPRRGPGHGLAAAPRGGGDAGLVDQAPGGGAIHGLLEAEREAIIELFEAWGDIDRSHRKLAHRGSRLGWCTSASPRSVVFLQVTGSPARDTGTGAGGEEAVAGLAGVEDPADLGLRLHPLHPGEAVRGRGPRHGLAQVDHHPGQPEETSTQVEVCFLAALESEGLLEVIDPRDTEQLRQALLSGQPEEIEPAIGDGQVPLLLAVSDNGPQMRSHSTREFLAGVHIAQHFGRPHTPTDQAWIETLFGHVKGEWPHLEKIADPGELDAELDRVRSQYNTVRLHASIGYVTPDDEHDGRGDAIRKARRDGLDQARQERLDYHRRSRGQ